MTNDDKDFLSCSVKALIQRGKNIRFIIGKMEAYGFKKQTIIKYFKAFSNVKI